MSDERAAEQRRSLLVEWVDPGVFRQAARSGKYPTGLELMRAIQEEELPRPPIAELLDFWPVEVEEGRTVFACVPGESHYNPIGTVHGGLAATLCDTAMGCAIHTRLPIEVGYTTLELKLNYIRPMTHRSGEVRCTGTVIHLGHRIATAEARLEDAAGALLAHGTTTCLILRRG